MSIVLQFSCLICASPRLRAQMGPRTGWECAYYGQRYPVHVSRSNWPRVRVALAVVACLAWVRSAEAQHWPDAPVSLAGGHVLVAGDVSATFGSEDPGWFTYTDYQTSAIRRARAGVTVEARASDRLAFLTELRAETGAGASAYAWYVRLSPFASGLVDIQAGRIPPVFGTYARRNYPQDNPLIGDPLGYQYLTTARPDAVPATADELLRMRARGWRVRYSVGDPAPEPGVPVIAAGRWDTGVQVRVGSRVLEAAAAWTAGTLSYPLVRDNNRGGQFAGRVVWRPVPAFSIGASAARGAWVTDAVMGARADMPDGRYDQRAVGLDGEASWGRWLLRGELVSNTWTLPALDVPRIVEPLTAMTGYVEVKVRVSPRLYVAARGDSLRFSDITGSAVTNTWDANVSRVEIGAGYTIRRGLIVKASLMNNRRDGGLVQTSPLAAVQVLFWF